MPDPHGVTGQIDWQAILPNTLPYVDIFTPSFEEILYMLDRERFFAREATRSTLAYLSEDVPVLADKALASGARIVLIKCGTSGAYLRTAADLSGGGRGMPEHIAAWQGRELWAPAFRPVRVAGTTGSGDASIAGFLAALLRGLSPEDTLKAGTAVGAYSVEAPDSLSGIRGWEETVARIRSGWEQLPLTVTASGWQWDEDLRLWMGPNDTRAASQP
jgi:sugar/nucleoside kinase (ribokinase family)